MENIGFIYPQDEQTKIFAGCDEAGRGPLVGNVVAAAVILDPNNPIIGLNDSKKLSEKKRLVLFEEIKSKALAYAIAECTPEEIDRLNILQASLFAMKKALEKLSVKPDMALIDGNKTPKDLFCKSMSVVKGDSLVPEISAASILAKVTRDNELYELDKLYPQYGFASHKGYPTKAHLEAIEKYGLLDCYRKSYSPVKKLLGIK
jgi:ribonuclease HII